MTDQELKDFIAKFAISVDKMKGENEKRQANYEKRQADYEKKQAESKANNDKMWAELKASMKANDDKLTRVGVRLDNIPQSNKDIAEEYYNINFSDEDFYPPTAEEYFYKIIKNTMKLGDISFDVISKNLTGRIKKINLEGKYDLILKNDKTVVFIETNDKMHENDVIKIKEKMIPTFRKVFPMYKDLKLFAGIASFHINKKVRNLAKEFGFYILEKKGNVMQTNSENVINY